MFTPPLPPGSWAMQNRIMDLRWNLVWEPEDTPPLKPLYEARWTRSKERGYLIGLSLFFVLLDLLAALCFSVAFSALFPLIALEAGALFLFWWGLGIAHDTLWRRGPARLKKGNRKSCSVLNLAPCLVFSLCAAPVLKGVLPLLGSDTEKMFRCGFGLCAAFAYLFLCWRYHRGHLFESAPSPQNKRRNFAAFLLLFTLLVICGMEFCWALGN